MTEPKPPQARRRKNVPQDQRWKGVVRKIFSVLVNPDAHFRHRFFGHLFTALFVVSLIGLLDDGKYLDRLKGATLDLFSLSMANSVSPNIVAAGGAAEISLVEVLITADEYREIFHRRSPLDRDELAVFFETLAQVGEKESLPLGVAVDLDLSPKGVDGQARLEKALVNLAQQLPSGLHLAAPQRMGVCEGEECPDRWMDGLRAASGGKIVFAAPYALPHQFLREESAQRLGVGFGRALAGEPQARPKDGKFPVVTPVVPFPTFTFTEARNHPERLRGTAVVLGGRYDSRDTLAAMNGERIDGSHAHALAALSEAYWLQVPLMPKGYFLLLKVVVGIVVGWGLAYLWGKVSTTGHRFFAHACWYLLFLIVGLGLPLAVLHFSFELMNWRIEPTSLALLMLGLLWDAAFSPQEDLLSRESADKRARRYRPRKLDWATLGGWALFQWGVVLVYLVVVFKGFAIPIWMVLLIAMYYDGTRNSHGSAHAPQH